MIGLIILVLLALSILVLSALSIRPSDVQLPVRYSVFGSMTLYRDKWYYLLALPLFAIAVATFHAIVGSKLLPKSRYLAIGALVLGSVVLIVTFRVALAVFNLVNAPL